MIDLVKDPEISIVMPCLNEAETIGTCIRKAQHFITRHGLSGEIIVADNGSTDGSQRIVKELNATVVHVEKKGYGAALAGAIAFARGKFVVMGDADDSYDFSDLSLFVEKLREGYDLVMGCRLPSGGGTIMPDAMPLKHRYFGNPVLSFIGRLFFRSRVTDFHCGLRGFSKEAFERMDMQTTGMEFASEMVIKAAVLGMRVAEVPIILHRDGRSRPSHLRSWRDGWRHLRFMLIYAPSWLFLVPAALFLGTGSVMFLVLLGGPVTVGGVIFDTNTFLVFSMSILMGFQLLVFYFFSKTFSVTEGLLPPDPLLNRLFSVFTLEKGLGLGIVIVIAGGAFLVSSLISWSKAGFGDLSYPVSLRKVIPAVTLSVLGLQIIFSSFFMSILGLHRK